MAPRRSASNRPPSMADVAALAGVSHQTVSRVLNNSESVRSQTRERVQQAIVTLGYRRNEAARTLATRQSRLFGLITADYVSYGPSSTVLSVQLAAKEQDYLVSVAVLKEFSEGSLRGAIDRFLGQGVAGIIVSVPLEHIANELDKIEIPVPAVAVASTWPTPDSPIQRVGVNQVLGIFELLNHLKSAGVTEVAHFAGPTDWLDSQQREEAWRHGCEERGLTASTLLRGDWSANSGYRLAQQVLTETVPQSIFIANDQMALGASLALSESGLQVGRDILIAGFDDEPGTAFFNPPLTTIRQDYMDLGRRAVGALLGQIGGEKSTAKLIPSRLIIRESA